MKRSRIFERLATLFTFACFFPYPAITVGNSTGLQISHILACILVLIVFSRSSAKRPIAVFLVLIAPLLVSALFNVLTGSMLSDDVGWKTLVIVPLYLSVLPVAGVFANREQLWSAMFRGAALAILVHVAFGLFQAYMFSQNVFPVQWLFQHNPSFYYIDDAVAKVYAVYTKRPFGMFPEPSAMAASIGPWVLTLAGLTAYPELGPAVSRNTRRLYAMAAAGGFLLLVLSRSGSVLIVIGSLIVALMPFFFRHMANLKNPTSLLFVAMSLLAVTGLVAWAGISLGNRLSLTNISWDARFTSLELALQGVSQDLKTLVFGIGPGQAHLFVRMLAPGTDTVLDVSAVWSVILTSVLESGLFGIVAWLIVIGLALGSVFRSSAKAVGFAATLAWGAGVTVTTSYWALSPVWLFLGLLVCWHSGFATSRVHRTSTSDEVPT